MQKVIQLKNIIDALEMTNEHATAYLDTKTGEILWYYDGDNYEFTSPELKDDNRSRLLQLFDCYEINEYHMMEVFAYDHDDRLVRAIQGRGAFRYFRDTVEELGLTDEWYEFRSDCYRSRAIRWCQGNNVKFFE